MLSDPRQNCMSVGSSVGGHLEPMVSFTCYLFALTCAHISNKYLYMYICMCMYVYIYIYICKKMWFSVYCLLAQVPSSAAVSTTLRSICEV